MTFLEARKSLPAFARWSSSFGNPGEGGYTEYWRVRRGDHTERYEISNGSWMEREPFMWSLRRLEDEEAKP